MKTIVIGTDGSEPAAAALAMAFQLAADTGAGVLCVGVDDSFSKDGSIPPRRPRRSPPPDRRANVASRPSS